MKPTRRRLDPADPNMPLGPYGSVGSVFNVVMCGLTVILGITQQQPGFFIVSAIFCAMEILFVRVMLRARRTARERKSEARNAANAPAEPR